MKLLQPPIVPQIEIFDACKSSVTDASFTARLEELRPYVPQISNHYAQHASTDSLHTLVSAHHGHPEQVISINLTKGDLTSLYEKHMVSRSPGRAHYDNLLLSAPLSKCPYCGFGQVSTLDHFASKSRYPLYSIEARNLVPACADCNKLLGSAPITEDSPFPHPYFGDPRIERDTWLHASIACTSPTTVSYFVASPETWDDQLRLSIGNYFNDLQLKRRFAIEGNSAIVEISDTLRLMANLEDRILHLRSMAAVDTSRRRNSWRAALSRALAISLPYVNGGYLQ